MKTNGRKVSLDQGLGETNPGTVESVLKRLAAPDGEARVRQMAVLRLGVGDLGRMREERVHTLRVAIGAGAYRVEPRLVAVGLLREVLGELLG